jgi:hypothetical protein
MSIAVYPSRSDGERAYEAVMLQKETRADQLFVVRKEATGRTERVRDTVRRTKAEVENAGVDK